MGSNGTQMSWKQQEAAGWRKAIRKAERCEPIKVMPMWEILD